MSMKRLASLDALRGFDMMWIMGAAELLEERVFEGLSNESATI